MADPSAGADRAEASAAAASAAVDGAPRSAKKRRPRFAVRSKLRALHRDVGYLLVGLTLVYAFSGLAVNHIDDWNPSFREFEREHQLAGPLVGDDAAVARQVLGSLGVKAKPTELYRASDLELEILLDERTLTVDLQSGLVHDQGREPRLLLRVANWLHLNRGKKAWTYVADSYAVLLLFLALSGMWMLPGRKGLLGRGGVLVAVGSAVPILYVVLSGGP